VERFGSTAPLADLAAAGTSRARLDGAFEPIDRGLDGDGQRRPLGQLAERPADPGA
jgi:hypothetical protein